MTMAINKLGQIQYNTLVAVDPVQKIVVWEDFLFIGFNQNLSAPHVTQLTNPIFIGWAQFCLSLGPYAKLSQNHW